MKIYGWKKMEETTRRVCEGGQWWVGRGGRVGVAVTGGGLFGL